MVDTRTAILDAADRLYYERGIQKVGIDELRAASGVSLKRMYSEFSSKDAIVLAVLERRHAMWVDGLAVAARGQQTPRGKLLAIFDFLADWFTTDQFRGCAFINAFGELGGSTPEIAAAARAHKQSFQDYVDELVAQAGGTVALARQLVLLAEGAQTTSAISGRPDAAIHAKAAAAVLISVVLD